MNKIGIMGGSFNPIHMAHLIIAEKFYTELNLDKVIFIPTFVSPFKIEKDQQEDEYNLHRVEMLKLATESNPKFDIDLFEIEQKGVSYTYLTINHLLEKYEDAKFYLLIGADNAAAFKKWKNWTEILKKATLTIAARPGFEDIEQIINDLSVTTRTPYILNTPNLEISSTMIRSNFQKNNIYRYCLPEKVFKYIMENNLYRS
jgi:nicotinate-nucleotide adenylyltransferase